MHRPLSVLVAVLALAACNGRGDTTAASASSRGGPAASAPAAPHAAGDGDDGNDDGDRHGHGRVLVVNPGDSIQAAVDSARPGDEIRVRPGTYHEAGRPCPGDATRSCAVVVGEDDLRLVGVREGGAGPVLEAADAQFRGIVVARTGDPRCLADPALRVRGARVEGFTVRGFGHDGIFLFCADDWRVAGNVTEANGEYGIFPSHSGKGRVTRNVATGSNDTGIYIGQSHDVRVDHNLGHDNVSGFEIENCSRVRLDHNVATGNTGGILTFTLPNLDVDQNQDNVVEDNVVTANNRPNTCADPKDTVCLVPQGTGILLLAADRNTIRRNVVVGNAAFGIAVFDFCSALGLDAAACAAAAPDIDPLPDGNRIVENVVRGNGGPDVVIPPGIPGGDLLWSGTGTGNCWRANLADVIVSPVPLPTCG